MIVKSRNVQASKVTQQKATSALKSHLKYLQYRERNSERESKNDRAFFNAERERIDRREIANNVLQERAGDIYYHRMVLSPASSEPVSDWKTWTRAVMHDVSQRLGAVMNWYAMAHHNTDNSHIHVVIQGTGIHRETGQTTPITFKPPDFVFLRESGREHSGYEQHRFLMETLRDLNERDTISNELPQREQPTGQRDLRQNEREASTDFGR